MERQSDLDSRRRIRVGAIWLALTAVAIYVTFIGLTFFQG